MLQHALRMSLLVVVLGFVAQDVHAFGRCGGWGRGCGGCGYGYGGGGYGYGGYGYGGYGYGGYGYGGYYGGWGYNGGYGYSGYLGSVNGESPSPAGTSQLASDRATLTVLVPADAKVFVNGLPTKSTGESRRFISTGLQPMAFYPYKVRAEFMFDGKLVSEEKIIQLTAGQTGSLAFDPPPATKVADVGAAAQR
jgi:uncharacterized protein (TIGR03000 family)